jgi:DNA topoisomerase-2
LEITELPIGISTQDYKESVMENMLHGSEKIPPIINDYKEYHTDSTVRFVVSMSEDKIQHAKAMGLHETFKLKTTLSRTPTELYDSNDLLRTYESDVGILKEFYKVRLEFYEKRRLSVKNKYKYLLNQCKLIREVCNGALTVDSKQVCRILIGLNLHIH